MSAVLDHPLCRPEGVVVPAEMPDFAIALGREHAQACGALRDARRAYDRIVVGIEEGRRAHRARVRQALLSGEQPPGMLDPTVDAARLQICSEDIARAALRLADQLDAMEATMLARRSELVDVVRQAAGTLGAGAARDLELKGMALLARFDRRGAVADVTGRLRAEALRRCPHLVDAEGVAA